MPNDLTRISILKTLLKNRWPQLVLMILMLSGFSLAILSDLIGTPVGNRNFGIVFVWIAWWAILILVAVPVFGRGWCAICPIPLPGEWLQRGAIHDPPAQPLRRINLRWPNKLRNIWLQNLSFTLVALFSMVILTSPKVTAIILAGMLFLAMGMSLIFQRRTFCRYLCPVGGFIGLYSQSAPIELRVKNKDVCMACKDKPCYNGSASGYGCPWDVFPGGLTKNTACGLCLECLRTCPYENITIRTRRFAADLQKPSTRMDEAFKAFIMLGAAMIYTGVFLGPWGWLKLAAYSIGSFAWFGYSAGFLVILFGLLPGFFLLAVNTARKLTDTPQTLRKTFTAFATVLVPLGLMFWVAFSLSFVLTNASYLFVSLSDPFGWGWDLFRTAATTWQPYLTSLLLPVQTLVLAAGLAWTVQTALKVGAEIRLTPVPVIVFTTLITIGMMGLLI